MKKSILFLCIIGILFSCKKNDDIDTDIVVTETELFGDWELVKLYGSTPNSETTGSEMEWQETYSFETDGTFQKSRDRNGVITEVFGTFELMTISDEIILKLIFNTDNNIIGSCTSESEETLAKRGDTLTSTWMSCDGPGLDYMKVN